MVSLLGGGVFWTTPLILMFICSILYNPIVVNNYFYVPNVVNGQQFYPNQINSPLGVYNANSGAGYACPNSTNPKVNASFGGCSIWTPPIRNTTLPSTLNSSSTQNNASPLNGIAGFLAGAFNYFIYWATSNYCTLTALGNSGALQTCNAQALVANNKISTTENSAVTIGGISFAGVYVGIIFAIISIVGIAGLTLFGSGLNSASIVVIFIGAMTLTLWASLTTLGAPIILSIPLLGYIIYGALTFSLVIGFAFMARGLSS